MKTILFMFFCAAMVIACFQLGTICLALRGFISGSAFYAIAGIYIWTVIKTINAEKHKKPILNRGNLFKTN
jgi:hypothetical protein